MLDIERLRVATRRHVGRTIRYTPETTSTNDEAWRLADGDRTDRLAAVDATTGVASHLDGCVVLAEHQTHGRGRLGRRWTAPRGSSLLCSVLLVDGDGTLEACAPALVGALAACEAVERAIAVVAEIKWPNDVLIRGRKVAGVLVERRVRRDGVGISVVGIGINCLQQRAHFPEELRARATSLDLESTTPVDRTHVACLLLDALDHWVAAARRGGEVEIRDAYLSRGRLMGRRLEVRQTGRVFTGTVIGLDPSMALLIQLESGGTRLFSAAEASVVLTDG